MMCLQLENLQYAYQKGTEILKGIDASFEKGKLYAITGPSGCGKTTLLSLMGGLDTPTNGQVLVDGENIAAYGYSKYRKHKVAFVFQSFNLIDYLTAEENVKLTSNTDAIAVLEKVGLSTTETQRSTLKLSGGQQQRVAIARALASEANLLLADEPTGNLDEETAVGIVRLLKESAHKMNKCVIVVTHSNELAESADIVYQLKSGLLKIIDN